MKKSLLFPSTMIFFFLITMNLNASVWRVNSSPGSSAHYSSIQDAHNAATTLNGDTLYIESCANGVGSLSASKTLTIIGTGYFLGENPETQANTLGSRINYIYFQSGSEGSKVMGCEIGQVRFYASNIFITRCRIASSSNPAIGTYASNLSNLVVTQSYISTVYYHWSAFNFSDASNVMVSNCYLFGSLNSNANFSGIFTHNVFNGNVNAHNSIYKNNILYSYNFTNNNSVFSYNIGSSTQWGSSNGNLSNVDMGTVFVGATGNSTDGQWQLKANSPALGAGENGVDCGMFGGASPYILSGMPNIPAIYYLNTPMVPSDIIDVAIKAKSHN